MTLQAAVPSCILELEKYWFLSGFLPLNAIVPPVPVEGESAPAAETPDDSEAQASELLFGGSQGSSNSPEPAALEAPLPGAGPSRRTWRELATRAFQPDPQLHAHLESILHEMEEHEDDIIDPLHRPWHAREFLKTIENYTKWRCRVDMNHCDGCGQMNPSEYTHCLRCRTNLGRDVLETALSEGTVDRVLQLEGFRILPSPCIKYFLLCRDLIDSPEWRADMKEVLRPLYFLFTRSRFLAGEMVADTTEHHIQAAADLTNLNRHLNQSLAKGKRIVESLQTHLEQNGGGETLRQEWAHIADAALEAQQNLCMMLDAWEEFEGVRLDQWWDDPAETGQGSASAAGSDAFGLSPIADEVEEAIS